jgi:pimeloyl-ACP methyl ester carboxylesterase
MESDTNKIPILLLHGAIGSNKQFTALQESLERYYEVHTPNFPGHGGEGMPVDFSMQSFAAFVKKYINSHQLKRPIVFGYSMGGYVACYLCTLYPSLFSGIITLATKFHWDKTIAAAESAMLQPDTLEQKVPKFVQVLTHRHSPQDWKTVLNKTAELLQQLGAAPLLTGENYGRITIPCLLLIGDRDKMVSIEETLSVYRALPHAQFSVLPATPHLIEQVPVKLLVSIIQLFVNSSKEL